MTKPLALALMVSMLPECTTVTFGWAREEVAVVGVHRADGGRVDGVLVNVKNIVGVGDGCYVIELPEGTTFGTTNPSESSSLTIRFDKARGTGIQLMWREFDEFFSDVSPDDLVPDSSVVTPFNLRAHVVHSSGREFAVDVEVDPKRDGNWMPVGSAHVGQGDQSSLRIVGACAALPVTLPLDACAAVAYGAGLLIVWMTFGGFGLKEFN